MNSKQKLKYVVGITPKKNIYNPTPDKKKINKTP